MLKIGDLEIGENRPCFIIAEIGQNHQGQMAIAKELILEAKDCGVSCVKFQKTSLSDRFTKSTLQTPYLSYNSFGATYGQHRAQLEFSPEEFLQLKEYAEKDVGIMFSSSCMDLPSATFLKDLGIPFMKIGSGDTNNPLLIEHVAKMGVPIILSTGMSDLETVKDAYSLIKKYNGNFALMHCVSAYPTAPEDVNLSVLRLYQNQFPDVPVGYSGHELGVTIAIAAVASGAKIIEKHFTLDKTMRGTDHACSLEPREFKQLVQGIRTVEAAMGKPVKAFLPSERPCNEKLGKTIVAAKKIEKDQVLQRSDIAIKVSRPHGIEPKYLEKIIGRRVNHIIHEDQPITAEVIVGGVN